MRNLILGSEDLTSWLYSLGLGLLGFVFYKLLSYKKRTEKNVKFDFCYWWKDNKIELYLGAIVFYILARFHSDLLELIGVNIDIPLINNRYLFIFVAGMLFQMIIKRCRKFLNIRLNEYACGKPRQKLVGGRPNDRA